MCMEGVSSETLQGSFINLKKVNTIPPHRLVWECLFKANRSYVGIPQH